MTKQFLKEVRTSASLGLQQHGSSSTNSADDGDKLPAGSGAGNTGVGLEDDGAQDYTVPMTVSYVRQFHQVKGSTGTIPFPPN